MARWLTRLGRAAARRAGLVLGGWAVALILAATAFVLGHGRLTSSFDVPGLPSATVVDQLAAELPQYAGASGAIVLRTSDGQPFSQALRDQISRTVAGAAGLPDVAQVIDPFASEAERQAQGQALEQGLMEMEQGRAQLEAGQAELDAGRALLEQSQAQLDQAQAQLDQAAAGLDPARLQAERAQLEAGRTELAAGWAELEAKQALIDAGRTELEARAPALEAAAVLLDLADPIRLVSPDGRAAQVTILFTQPRLDLDSASKQAAIDYFTEAGWEGIEVAVSVDLSQDVPDILGWGEVVGLGLAALVLVVMFRALAPMAAPVIGALTGVAVVALGSLAFSSVVTMTSITPILAVMLGLAVGVDYALFIIYRHRQQLLAGQNLTQSIGAANGTSGTAVVFAGSTVVVALAALNLTGVPFLGLMGSIAAAAVALAVLVALTLTPALLGLMGWRVLPRRLRPTGSESSLAGSDAAVDPGAVGSGRVQDPADAEGVEDVVGTGDAVATNGHPATADAPGPADAAATTASAPAGRRRKGRDIVRALVVAAVLLVVASPALSLRLGLPDGSSEPLGSLGQRADAILAAEFGPGANGPLLVTADLPAGLDETSRLAAQAQVALALGQQDGVLGVALAGVSDSGALVAFQVLPQGGPNDESTAELVRRLRALASPTDGVALGVAGQAAINIDLSERLGDVVPVYLAVVVGLSLLLLLLVFRSLLVPLIAAGGFILSLFATLGALVAVFQWGWAGPVLGLHSTGPVLNFLPIILAGVLFGLAMDYQIFLASGMREAYAGGVSADQAVSRGLAAGRPVVLAAALIMVAIFGGFVLSDSTIVKSVGFGLGLGVVADALLVRLVLMPALMRLLGPAAWWLPAWLDRLLPRFDIEGAADPTAQTQLQS
ncbi:MAG: MMPL family transporter [Propionibacteriaceae bacterium]|nr:MMPL family transporter [Propionibacteriaceae bacterium]